MTFRRNFGRRSWQALSTGAALAIAGIVAGCSDKSGPTEQLIGPIARIVSPNGAEGSAIGEFAGTVDSIMVAGGKGYLHSVGGITRAALILDQPGLIRFSLPKVAGGSAPSATVVEVADGANQLRAGVSGYQVTYER